MLTPLGFGPCARYWTGRIDASSSTASPAAMAGVRPQAQASQLRAGRRSWLRACSLRPAWTASHNPGGALGGTDPASSAFTAASSASSDRHNPHLSTYGSTRPAVLDG